jgi:hypothetical protein
VAIGVTQITKATLKILQDPKGEVKEFIFNKVRQKDLKDREPTAEEVILDYKGLLKSKTIYKGDALDNFRENYAKLKNK